MQNIFKVLNKTLFFKKIKHYFLKKVQKLLG